VYELCNYLVSRHHDVHLFTNSYEVDAIPGLSVHHIPMIKAGFLEKRRLHAFAKLFQIWTFAFSTKLLVNVKQFDVVHTQGDSLAKAHVRTAHSCHRSWLVGAKKSSAGFVKKLLRSRLNPLHFIILLIEKRDCQLNCKKVISVSTAVADEIYQSYHIPRENIVSILNGVDTGLFNPSNRGKYGQAIREKYGISKNDFIVLFVGHEFERKGLNVVFEVLSTLDNKKVRLLVVGNDKEHSFKEKRKAMGLENQVVFAGGAKEVEKYYAAADVLVLPAAYEPFGLVVSEAMASGLPVIVSKTAGAAEIIKDGINGLVIDPLRITEDMKRCLSLLIEKPDAADAISQAARKTILDYTWEKMGERTEKVYEEIVNGR
jgi:UDP-glucose:(heptosyl)LPS alpha-1,3-glucosyltransferase